MENALQKVNNFFGPGAYEEWIEMEQKFLFLKNKYQRTRKQTELFQDKRYIRPIGSDVAELEKITCDYKHLINLLTEGNDLNADGISDARVRQNLMFSIAREEISLAGRIIFIQTWFTNFVAPGIYCLKQKARTTLRIIEELNHQLGKAKKKLNEAEIKAVISIACNSIRSIMLSVEQIVSSNISTTPLLLDMVTQNNEKQVFKVVTGKILPCGQNIAGNISVIEKNTVNTRLIARGTGKKLRITRFFFDVDEVLVGYRNRQTVKTQLSQVMSALNDLKLKYGRIKPVLRKYDIDFDTLIRSINSTQPGIAKTREMYNAMRLNSVIPYS